MGLSIIFVWPFILGVIAPWSAAPQQQTARGWEERPA
jgi:hypothetical protein